MLLLADEPTGNLDRTTADTVGSLLLDLNREQQTILICVTHSTELAARFPRQMRLTDGKLQLFPERGRKPPGCAFERGQRNQEPHGPRSEIILIHDFT